MSDNNFNLINFDGKPLADVACKLIDALSQAAGYIFPSDDVRKAKSKAHASIIMEIAEDKNVDSIERGAKITSYNKNVKEYINQNKIISGAIPFLKENAKPEKMDEDWILFFMDKVRLVSNEKLQFIWSRILAHEVNDPDSISKQLMHILSQMRRKDADTFMKLSPICVSIHNTSFLEGDYLPVPVVPNLSLETSKKYGISFADVMLLESYGLIKNSDQIRFKATEVKYGTDILYVSEKDRMLNLGVLSFTQTGLELFEICERTYDNEISKNISEYINTKNK